MRIWVEIIQVAKHALSLFALVLICPSCSIMMAMDKSGTTANQVQKANSRNALLSACDEVLDTERAADGNLIETYQFQKQNGSTIRGCLYAILDYSTYGLWELIGTSFEEQFHETEYFSAKVYFDANENVKKVEILKDRPVQAVLKERVTFFRT